MKLRILKSSIKTLGPSLKQAQTLSDQRMAGRKLQSRRLRMWTKSPCCEKCGLLTDWPSGFELDHRVRLDQGGSDTEGNCQVLCVHYAPDGSKLGCHAEKTASESRRG